MNTGIPFDTWVEGDQRALMTALDLTENSQPPTVDGDGRQMSG